MKLYVGCPSYLGQVQCNTAAALSDERLFAYAEGIQMEVRYLMNAHYISEAYNIMLAEFMAGDWDKFCTVEWDVSWGKRGQLLEMVKIPYDCVGGSTRYKEEPERYMVGWFPGQRENGLWIDDHGCIECVWVPQGFSAASRDMCQKMWDACADREYDVHGKIVREVFHEGRLRLADGDVRRPGQDIWWCLDWHAMGGKVHVWVNAELTHTASPGHAYTGRLGDYLTTGLTDEEKARAEAIAEMEAA